jgi:hypothetical protein
MHDDPVEILRVGMIPVVTPLVFHIEKDQEGAGHTHGQSEDIDGRMKPVAREITQDRLQISAKHGTSLVKRPSIRTSASRLILIELKDIYASGK